METVLTLVLWALLPAARSQSLLLDLISRQHVSTTPSYEENALFPLGTNSPTKFTGSGGFWGLPPPPDSPYMGSASTPDDILSPPTSKPWEARGTRISSARPRTSLKDTSNYQDLPSSGIAAAWCNKYQTICRNPKREANELSIRITGGQPAAPKEHPHMVLVGYGPKSNKQWLCGGSLISEKFVLSAAHCVNTTKMGFARWARLGDLDISTSEDNAEPQERQIVERLIHPSYQEPAVYHDIALFRLDREVRFSPWVRPVCLHTDSSHPAHIATITGWGRTDFVSDTSPTLMEVDVRIFNTSTCKSLIDPGTGSKMRKGFDPDTMLCAGEERGGKDACQGDSGGPLVVEGKGCLKVLAGITSVGKECGLPNSPGVYTRVHHYVSWIERIVWE